MFRKFFVGDFHGMYEDMLKISKKHWQEQEDLGKSDILFQLGDFGLVWWHDQHPKYKKDQAILKDLSERNFTTCFVAGNHENFDLLNDQKLYPDIPMFGSVVQKIAPSVYRLKNGHIYTIGCETFFVMGGARSDEDQKKLNYSGKGRYRKLRKQPSWWEEEIPSEEEFALGLENLSKCNYKVDYILTHTCPSVIMKDLYDVGGEMDLTRLDDPVSLYLDKIAKIAEFKEWHFGHHHLDVAVENDYGKFFCHYRNLPCERS